MVPLDPSSLPQPTPCVAREGGNRLGDQQFVWRQKRVPVPEFQGSEVSILGETSPETTAPTAFVVFVQQQKAKKLGIKSQVLMLVSARKRGEKFKDCRSHQKSLAFKPVLLDPIYHIDLDTTTTNAFLLAPAGMMVVVEAIPF